MGNWKGKYGVDGRWENCLLVLDAEGNVVEAWTQWDKLFKRPHAIYINPYDPEKSVWVVDDARSAIFKFSNDGKNLLQTIGTPNEPGDDETHYGRPTFLAWLPDGTMFVADGYTNTRVVKLDKDGKYLMEWGKKGTPPNDKRPGYFNTVHGIAVDPITRYVYVTDRQNGRAQVFDENGHFLDQWSYGLPPGHGRTQGVYYLYMSGDRYLWAADATTSKILKYDRDGHFLYSWGSFGSWPGAFWGVHQFSVDQDGNLYVAEVENGRVQKFRPRKGANPELLVGQPVRAAWK
ncbi:MAG TPA: peptidyl-alpha-hydroxyglycine alpha-amidating lyase family protein [Terriglobia bacterium]|nr:peptidyl-alpha-hydroxyglycine alpha-amidating lyase family protein [Terriglobia bacterium]